MTYISQEIPKAGATMSLWDGSLPEGVNPDDLPPSCFGPGEIKNITVKFRAFLKGLEKLGIQYDYFCTGHYAKIVRPENDGPCMISAVAPGQSAILYVDQTIVGSGIIDSVIK